MTTSQTGQIVATTYLTVLSTAFPRKAGESQERIAGHYDEKALATPTLAIGQIGFFIAPAVIGKRQPAASPADGQRG
ncbi:hypothetical protein [Streptomyces subrutilus]|uniref:Uncharacterized protein n=1 Tax=Streptomyces subrutilus TaxID=36818 RepID=A0A918RGV5_9ACTN|nr:hypothetical protein [Streptomyces subrutilus]GGZ98540.1 hypothetical protein GCM10010371_67730 [Streptomyces subrutilus]